MPLRKHSPRVAFQGEPGAFSEEAARRLLGEDVSTLPCPTFAAAFQALGNRAAQALVVPLENSLAGSVLPVYDLMRTNALRIQAETILPIEHHLIGCPGASLAQVRSVESHPMALAQCERFLGAHPKWKRVSAEDTAGSVREVVAGGDRTRAAIAGERAARRYGGVVLARNIEDNAGNFTRFVLLSRRRRAVPGADKMTLAVRIAHRPGALLAALEPFARHGVNLLKIESRPIHGCPWQYLFFIDLAAETGTPLETALDELRRVAQEVRVLGLYRAASAKGDVAPMA
jgi:prephenate dehydratase